MPRNPRKNAYNEQKKRFEPIIFALITDIIATDESTEVTSVTVPQMINANGVDSNPLKIFIFSDLLYSSNNVIGIWLFVQRVIQGWFKAL